MHQPLATTSHPDLAGNSTPLRDHWRILTLCALSAVMTALYVYGRPYILYNDGDPLAYFRKAWWFIGHAGGVDVPSRGPGYPIWLILTGAAPLNVWWGLVVSHIAMAFAAPALVYGILSPISRNAGFAAGLLFILFAISYQHMSWVMTEELFLFMELLSLLLISWYLCGAWTTVPKAGPRRIDAVMYRARLFVRTPYAIALTLAYTTMVKPAGGLFFWIFLVVCLLFRIGSWKRSVGPAILYAAIMAGWGTFDYLYSPVRFSPLGMPQDQAQRNFADVYYGQGAIAVRGWAPTRARNSATNDPIEAERGPASPDPEAQRATSSATIKADRGPASQRLYQAVVDYIDSQQRAGKWNTVDSEAAYQLYGRYSREALVELIFARPNPFYFQLVMAAAAATGEVRLLREVAREHGNAGVMAYANYLLRNPTVPFLGPPNPYVGFMFFMKFYRHQHFREGGHGGARDIFGPSTKTNLYTEAAGPASKDFAQAVRFFVACFPEEYLGLPPELIREFGSKEGLVKYVIEHPYSAKHSGAVMGWIFQWFMILFGEERAGRVMGAAAIETIKTQPATWGFLVGDYLSATAFGPIAGHFNALDMLTRLKAIFVKARDLDEVLLSETIASGRVNNLPPAMGSWIGEVGNRTTVQANLNSTQTILYGVFKLLKPVFFLLMMLFVFPLLMVSRGRQLVLFLTMCFYASAAAWLVVMIMPGSDPRHEDVFAFMPLLVSVLGFASLPQFIRLIRRNSAVEYPEKRFEPGHPA